jgi:hypothetical protein
MTAQNQLTIVALFLTSVLVRIVPSLVRLPLSDHQQALFERILPTAVFINFAVYILFSEISKAALPAIAAFLLLALLSVFTRMHMVLVVIVTSALYFIVSTWPWFQTGFI